jgi:hypothetical protein
MSVNVKAVRAKLLDTLHASGDDKNLVAARAVKMVVVLDDQRFVASSGLARHCDGVEQAFFDKHSDVAINACNSYWRELLGQVQDF